MGECPRMGGAVIGPIDDSEMAIRSGQTMDTTWSEILLMGLLLAVVVLSGRA